ncbi:MAG: AAA family ATPase [Hyphomonadaceae bacterium]
MSRLKRIVVENFRSIHGEVAISLDAPVVLIHGQNGTGKTSLLSALELALTGAVPSLQRADPEYLQHLPHKSSPDLAGKIRLEVESNGKGADTEIGVSRTAISGRPILNAVGTRFFSERCFLAQSTLSRLLEIYQHQDNRRTDSPLTRFVKELIGLDRLDALIEGLHPAGDVRRLREPAPDYWHAREELPALEAALEELNAQLDARHQESSSTGALIAEELVTLELPTLPSIDDPGAVSAAISTAYEEQLLTQLARVRRDLRAVAERWNADGARPGEQERVRAAAREQACRLSFDDWNREWGQALLQAATNIDEMLGGPSRTAGLDPRPLRDQLQVLVVSELTRIEKLVAQDVGDSARIADLGRNIAQGRQRITNLDLELGQLSELNQQLAQALSTIAPHVHSDDCPVCGRDFSEVSDVPLASALSKRIADLVQSAARLQALTRDKVSSTAAIAVAEREVSAISVRMLTPAVRDQLKTRQALLKEIQQRLQLLDEQAKIGQGFLEEWRTASRAVSAIGEGDQQIVAMREQLKSIADLLFDVPPEDGEELGAALKRLQEEANRWEEETSRKLAIKKSIAQRVHLRTRLSTEISAIRKRCEVQRSTIDSLREAKQTSDERIGKAKELARRVRDVRTGVVRRVFNEDLNALWRSLFIRLAPDEPFVPAFSLPATPNGPVEANLETIYRRGGKGGNPRAMLSAGNLNTAALTLFFALHLSARPQLPWLIIDDPVQSMDEVHIAQFAAVLRNLAKVQRRQIILAVHERPLFDYLSLELSPAFLDDRLITVELSRSMDGTTTAIWQPRVFEPDRAIQAA